MLGGGRCPPCSPPAGRPLAGGEASSASPFGRLILIRTVIIIDNHNNDDDHRIMLGGGRCPLCTPLLAGLRPAGNLERFAPSVVIMDDGSGGAPAPSAPLPFTRPSASWWVIW